MSSVFMKPSASILSMMAVLFFVTSSALGDASDVFMTNGIAKHHTGDLEGALTDFDKAIELAPSDGFIYMMRGAIKKEKGDLDGALRDLNKAIELDPKLGEPYYSRGVIKRTKGDLDGSNADF
jgi:Flp pilus assembly protein TadD